MSASFVLPLRIYYEDTDAAGIVYYANYLRYFERARTEWLRSLGYERQRLADEFDTAFVVRSVSCDYLKPARLDDSLSVVAQIESVSRAQLVFRQRVERQEGSGGEVLVRGVVRVACIAASRLRAKALPREMQADFSKLVAKGAIAHV